MTALIVFGLSRIEMTEGASQMAFNASPILKSGTNGHAVSTSAGSEQTAKTAQIQTPDSAPVRVILALK